jgi:hypothetical protein
MGGRGVFDKGRQRQIVLSLQAPNVVGARLSGTRRTYYITAEAVYMLALKAELRSQQLEKARAAKAKKRERRRR